MRAHDWRPELVERFAPRADPTLRRVDMPGLSELADELLDDPTDYDVDLLDLLRFAVEYANSSDQQTTEIETRALRTAGAAFLHVGWSPTNADIALIAKGNGKNYSGDPNSKLARDTWSYLIYKRMIRDDQRGFYSYKPGADMRNVFRDALLESVEFATSEVESFRTFCKQQRQSEREGYALDYADKQQGVASTETRIDRSDARDVNFPDGSLIPLGAHFTKTWEVRNIGQVAWIGRRLTRITPQGPTFPSSPDWIPIPDTFPGQTIQLSIDFAAGRLQGFSTVRFKMTDAEGNLYFPGKYPYGLTLLIETGGFEWIDRVIP